MQFADFKHAVAKQFKRMSAHPLFRTTASKDALWATYLGAFPEGSNPIYKTRTEHDCNCCKQFIRAVGNVVAIIDGQLVSIWDITIDNEAYQQVTNAMSELVKADPIDNVFLTTERTAGTDKNFQDTVDGIKTWEHFFVNIPEKFVAGKTAIGPKLGEARADHDVLLRSLQEITADAVDTVLELIAQGSLYRGEEHKFAVGSFKALKAQASASITFVDRDLLVWSKIKSTPQAVCRIRNTSIGTLLTELSEGMDLENAVKRFEAMVAPANYKRPTALVTPKMIEAAKKTVEGLGLTSALERRYARIEDISINNVLFASRAAKSAMGENVFDDMIKATPVKNMKTLAKVEEVSLDLFLNDILPKASGIEVLFENKHQNNLVSLIAPVDPTARPLFKWDNGFSWSYNGNMADSIKEKVKAAGGNVTGELCCRLAWEYVDDLDFHMHEPTGEHIYYGQRGSSNGGKLDVDANGSNGMRDHPVENIFYQRLATMRDGTYNLSVHNFSRRSDGVGFEIEIDILGTIHHMVYDKVIANRSTIHVADILVNKGKVEVIPKLPTTTASKQVWNIPTQTFHRVNAVMHSPNYWDGQGIGNKHVFFMLDDCRNEDKARGFFNEFLKPELNEHRKVLEMVGSKMKTDQSEHQLSGLGFSTTQRNELVVRVGGSFSRIVKVIF